MLICWLEFEKLVGLFTFLGLKHYLEDILGCSVDLGTPDSLRPALKKKQCCRRPFVPSREF